MVLQFGFAMIRRPPGFSASSTSRAFTSGTTSGQSASMRKALELSITTAPARAGCGANSRETEARGEKSAMSRPANESGLSRRTVTSSPMNSSFWPSLRSEASGTSSLTANSRSSSTFIISRPTAPVAPAIATLYFLISSAFRRKRLHVVRRQRKARLRIVRRPAQARETKSPDGGRPGRAAQQAGTLRQAQIAGQDHLDRPLGHAVAEGLDEQPAAPRLRGRADQPRLVQGDGGQARGPGDGDAPRVRDRLRGREPDAQPGERAGADSDRDGADVLQIPQRSGQHVARLRRRIDPLLAQDPIVFEQGAGGSRGGRVERQNPHSNHFRIA